MTGRQEGKGTKLLHQPKACEFISIIKRWLGTGPGQSCGQVSSKETTSHCSFLLYVPFLHVLMYTLDFDLSDDLLRWTRTAGVVVPLGRSTVCHGLHKIPLHNGVQVSKAWIFKHRIQIVNKKQSSGA